MSLVHVLRSRKTYGNNEETKIITYFQITHKIGILKLAQTNRCGGMEQLNHSLLSRSATHFGHSPHFSSGHLHLTNSQEAMSCVHKRGHFSVPVAVVPCGFEAMVPAQSTES